MLTLQQLLSKKYNRVKVSMSEKRTAAQAREKAESLFRAGYNCAQSVIGTFCTELGLDFDSAMKLAQPFGGGMGRLREVCGAVSGMLMCAGLAEGTSDPSDRQGKDRMYENVQQLAARFIGQNGSIVCRELLGLVPLGQSQQVLENGQSVTHIVQQPRSAERTDEYYKKRPCVHLVGDAACLLQLWLDSRLSSHSEQADS
jgi:C_GCAxxG_C_C family probable redox protein